MAVVDAIEIERGSFADYAAMAAFHYRGGKPAGVMRVLVAHYRGPGLGGPEAAGGMRAGVIVETLPPLGCALRTAALPGRFACADRSLAAAKLNREMRTIARVVVHPVFRSAGVAVRLVRALLAAAQTPYVEALAAMGRVNPFFERAGMRAYDRPALPDAVRLTAALAAEGWGVMDLAAPREERVSAFLGRELLRFSRTAETVAEALAEARRRLLSQPVYYLWTKEDGDGQGRGHRADRAGETAGASQERERDATGGDGKIAPAHRAHGAL
jgi:hypothetical protein